MHTYKSFGISAFINNFYAFKQVSIYTKHKNIDSHINRSLYMSYMYTISRLCAFFVQLFIDCGQAQN